MRISYGIEVKDEDDQYVAAVETGVATFNEAFVPGAFLVETFPILKHVPSWFPGAGFKRTAAAWKDVAHNMRNAPFEKTMESWVRLLDAFRSRSGLFIRAWQANGTAEQSIATTIMENAQGREDSDISEERIIARDVSALAYVGRFVSEESFTMLNLGAHVQLALTP